MSMGLPNAKFGSGQPMQRLGLTSRQFKVAPSIAEQAIFIPKPHDRVDFKLVVGGGQQAGQGEVPLMGGKNAPEAIPLPGSGAGPKGDNIAAGELGVNGVTARFGKSAWGGGSSAGGRVQMVINSNPGKMNSVNNDPIPTQEEGRQVNNKQIHFTQQYDAYGRPRIGFSREPYDFAATKFVSITSQVDFQTNMAKLHEHFDQYLLSGSGASQAGESEGTSGSESHAQPSVMGQDKVDSMSRPPVMGQEKIDAMSQPSVMGQEKIDAMSQPAVMGQDSQTGFSEIPVFGSTSGDTQAAAADSEGAGDSRISAGEAFEKSSSTQGDSRSISFKLDSAYGTGKEKNPAGSVSVSA